MDSILRQQAEALIQEQLVNTVFQGVPANSAVLSMMHKLPNMTSKQTRIPVLDLLPVAYFRTGDTGRGNVSKQAWDKVYLTAADLDVYVPISLDVIADSSYDIVGEVVPRVNEAFGQKIDGAIGFGVGAPSEWQSDIITLARQAGNNVSGGITYDTLLGTDGVFDKVEQMGNDVNGVIGSPRIKASLRGLKDSDNRPLYNTDMKGATPYALDGAPIFFLKNGAFDSSICQMIVGDFNAVVYSIRQDIDVKLLDQAVIQDPTTGEIVYNCAQDNMICLKATLRLGWAVPNPATRLNGDRTMVPFAYIEPTTPVTDYAVTFTVKDNAETPAAIAGARIDVNGAKKTTAANGTAVFNLRAGTFPATIKKSGYATQTATVTVTSAAVPIAITLPIAS